MSFDEDPFHDAKNRMNSAQFRLEQYIDQHIEEWTSMTVLDSIIRRAKRQKVPASYIAALRVVKKGWMRADVELNYNDGGKPLGLWFEFGTQEHEIEGKPWLAFFWKKVGKFVRFRRVNHPGQKGKYIMTKGYKNGKKRLRALIVRESNRYMEESKIP